MLDNASLELQLFGLAILCGLVVRVTLAVAKQRWAETYSNTVTYLLLPVVGLVIVQVISNSIALSLGMIGALSIVRFRHPVKSPLELTIYFLLLTIGVTLSQRRDLALLLTVAAALLIVGVSWLQRWRERSGRSALPVLMDSGDPSCMLEIVARSPLQYAQDSEALVFSYENAETNTYSYKLIFGSRAEWTRAKSEIMGLDGIVELSGSFD